MQDNNLDKIRRTLDRLIVGAGSFALVLELTLIDVFGMELTASKVFSITLLTVILFNHIKDKVTK